MDAEAEGVVTLEEGAELVSRAAVEQDRLGPPLTGTEMSGAALELEQLVDEYAIADGLDTRRRNRLAGLIVDKAKETGLAAEAGLAQGECEQEALRKIDTWLCDLKDLAVKDGLHIFGRDAHTDDAHWLACADAERSALLDALEDHDDVQNVWENSDISAADLEAMQGVRDFPVRIKCALLAWNTLDQILKEIRTSSE